MTADEYVPEEADVRAWCRDGAGDYPDVMDEWLDRFLARVRRDAAREALDGLADHSDNRDGDGAKGRLGGIIRIWRDAHYPEETP